MRPREATIGNIKLIATVNSRLVLHAVRVLQPTYRAELARADWSVLDELPPSEPGEVEIAVAVPEQQGYYRVEAVIY